MKQTKIDWCDCTINPIIGCKNGCPYCYARKINNRFHFIDKWDEPQFFPERLEQLKSKKPKAIFMDSMSDVGWWKPEWGYQVFDAMSKNPQHNYIFLTKCKSGLNNGIGTIWTLRSIDKCRNIFIGMSLTRDDDFNGLEQYDFLSIEPILEPINLSSLKYNLYVKQVIIGAETGNRKGKVIPKKEWIDDIVKQCDEAKVRVFMKESLREIMGEDFRQDELIWSVKNGK